MNAKQRHFIETCAGHSQNARILAYLRRCRRVWIDMLTLARIGSGSERGFCMVHSRVSDLRHRGYRIDHKNQRFGAQVHSFYRLK